MSKPRRREIEIAAVKAFRRDDAILNAIYGSDTTPADPIDRDRIYAGDPARPNEAGLEVAVHIITSGGSHQGRHVEERRVLQMTPIATGSWYEANGYLAFNGVNDALEARLESPLRDAVYPRGPAGSGGEMELSDGTGRRKKPFRWRVATYWTTTAADGNFS